MYKTHEKGENNNLVGTSPVLGLNEEVLLLVKNHLVKTLIKCTDALRQLHSLAILRGYHRT